MNENIVLDRCVENLKKYFDKINRFFPNYEERNAQKSMIWTIIKSYYEEKHALIEAQTGTGKSLGYTLAFLAAWEQWGSKSNRPKLVISTNTIALQEQLFNKDLPLIKEILNDLDFEYAVIKGRSNYLCLRKFTDLLTEDVALLDTKEEAFEYNKVMDEIFVNDEIIKWDKTTFETIVSSSLWDKMSCDSDSCLGGKCPYNEECFYKKMKDDLEDVDIYITNHSLFFADLSVRMQSNYEASVLPEFDFVVFDEAHNIEDVASNFLGTNIGNYKCKRLLTDIAKSVTKGELALVMENEEELKTQIVSNCAEVRNLIEELFKEITDYAREENIKRLSSEDIDFVTTIQIDKKISQIQQDLKLIMTKCELTDEKTIIVKKLIERLTKTQTEFDLILSQSDKKNVYWIETQNKDNKHLFTTLNTCPVTVADILSENLFAKRKSIVLTSATMGTSNMQHIVSRLGIDNYMWAMYHSPFDFKNQSRIYIPQNALNPKQDNYETYIEEEIRKIINISKGRALVLFTSYKLMETLSVKFRDIINEMGYTFLKQGDMGRTPLINRFKQDVNSVLFATSSYWEGIDVPGEALSCVIITRLPFEVPDHPVISARMEKLESEGKNSFAEYQVPVAIMKFKQGFGRLIRTNTDKGVVAVLDSRLVTMYYGKQFIKSLPPVPITRNIEEIKSILD